MKTSVVLIHLYLIGRTGITAITIAFGFLVSIFFSPIFASFPPWATGPALIVVGCMMTTSVRHINWDYPGGSYIITSVFWGRAHHSTVFFYRCYTRLLDDCGHELHASIISLLFAMLFILTITLFFPYRYNIACKLVTKAKKTQITDINMCIRWHDRWYPQLHCHQWYHSILGLDLVWSYPP